MLHTLLRCRVGCAYPIPPLAGARVCSQVRGKRPGKHVNLTETEIRTLCLMSREIFVSQPILLELEAPLKIVGAEHSTPYCLLFPLE